MANLEVEGRLVRKLPVVSGNSARGPWEKQEFLLEIQEGKFPSTVIFSVWGEDKVRELGSFSEGDTLRVSFNISSREYNGRWYTDLRAWRVENAAAAAAPAASGGWDRNNAAPAAPQDLSPVGDDSGDDLPF